MIPGPLPIKLGKSALLLQTFILFSTISFIAALTSGLHAQNLVPITIDEKIQKSSVIVEGKVIEQESFWNADHTMIFTNNKVEVYKLFKGTLKRTFVEVRTNGGDVDGTSIQASDLLSLSKGDIGVFFCSPDMAKFRSSKTSDLLLDVYSSTQGFLKYNMLNGTANAPHARYKNITNELYRTITSKVGKSYETRNSNFSAPDGSTLKTDATNAPVITSFSPAIVTAGTLLDPTNNVLTINGTGFGAVPAASAAVFFDDAVDGDGGSFTGVAFNNTNYIISWTNTQIRLRVPSDAGTGDIIVQDNAGVQATSPTQLGVLYSLLTVNISGLEKESNLMNDNGTGGYTVLYSTNTAGSGVNFDTHPAKATFQRALNTWKEVSGLNVVEGGTTTIQTIAGDANNIVVFDNTNAGAGVTPLPAGVLAVCYSFNSMCGPVAANQAQLTEFDIIVRNTGVSTGATTFSLGPCPPLSTNFAEIDLETVILHELGHALALGHIIDPYEGGSIGHLNPNKLMNFAVVNSVKRNTPDFSALAGSLYSITPQGNTYGACALSNVEMTPLVRITEAKDECPGTFPVVHTPNNTVVAFDLAHATSNLFTDPQFQQYCDATGTSVTNNAYYAFRTNAAGGILTLSISGYGTSPAAQSACTPAYAFPVTGVGLAIYQVNSCPGGAAFPATVACRTITGNGALANITGLTPNTNYLILVDGIENTKASFSLTFSGPSLLPLRLSSFNGEPMDSYNYLHWLIDAATDVNTLKIERSKDGRTFESIGEATSSLITKNGNFKDLHPYTGSNYYRLAIVNADGSKEYSKVVHLQRKDVFLISIFPNPTRNFANIEISSEVNGKYSLVIHNSFGQAVIQKNIVLNNNRYIAQVGVSSLSAGIYHVTLYDEMKHVIKTSKLTIE